MFFSSTTISCTSSAKYLQLPLVLRHPLPRISTKAPFLTPEKWPSSRMLQNILSAKIPASPATASAKHRRRVIQAKLWRLRCYHRVPPIKQLRRLIRRSFPLIMRIITKRLLKALLLRQAYSPLLDFIMDLICLFITK